MPEGLNLDDRVICEVADRLLLRVDLGQLLPEPAGQWLQAYGAKIHLNTRVSQITEAENGFAIDGETIAAAIMATTPQHVGAPWPPAATDHTYEPIATDYLPIAGRQTRESFPPATTAGRISRQRLKALSVVVDALRNWRWQSRCKTVEACPHSRRA